MNTHSELLVPPSCSQENWLEMGKRLFNTEQKPSLSFIICPHTLRLMLRLRPQKEEVWKTEVILCQHHAQLQTQQHAKTSGLSLHTGCSITEAPPIFGTKKDKNSSQSFNLFVFQIQYKYSKRTKWVWFYYLKTESKQEKCSVNGKYFISSPENWRIL